MSTRSDNLMQQIQIQLLKDKLLEERLARRDEQTKAVAGLEMKLLEQRLEMRQQKLETSMKERMSKVELGWHLLQNEKKSNRSRTPRSLDFQIFFTKEFIRPLENASSKTR